MSTSVRLISTVRPRAVAARSSGFVWLRRFTVLNLIVFCWSFVLATPMQALSDTAAKQKSPVMHSVPQSKLAIPHFPVKLAPPASTHCVPPLPNGTPLLASHRSIVPPLTLLDEVGNPVRGATPAQVATWKQQLQTHHLPAHQSAKLHLWLGEYALAHDQQPEQALRHFEQVQKLVKSSDRCYGLAAYDSAIALYYEGAYRDATIAFRRLLSPKTSFPGYDRKTCALWLRHSGACAGYHAERARLGIPEPPKLDPLCGAAALAAWLRAQKLPFDKKTVLAACRVTGRGSSLQDVLSAATKLGLVGYAVSADDKGLMALPKPLIAHVEHDHFVSVIEVDKQGVSYLCSDCGPWPGGKVDLTWKQWHKLEASTYGVVCQPGSAEDQVLSQLVSQKETSPLGLRLASVGTLAGLPLQNLSQQATLLALLKGHVVLYGGTTLNCGYAPSSQHCHRCYIPCPDDSSDAGGAGPQADDPVNLATGEEEYTPAPDLIVYNPIGPSVVWGRLYNSLRGKDDTYQDNDFGAGWSHPYNVGVYDPGIKLDTPIKQGSSGTFLSDGTDMPAGSLTWDIRNISGTTVATSSSPGGWNVAASSNAFTVTVPASATIGTHYQVRYNTHLSGHFDVVAASTTNPQVPQGGSATFNTAGNEAPASGLTWDVLNSSGGTVATSANPNGWQVSLSTTQHYPVTISAPYWATIATNYKVRAKNGTITRSVVFDVTGSLYSVIAGTKYLYLPNGARVSFTAPAVPTASQPTVNCTVQAGIPLLVEWDYDANDSSGHYLITFPDRTKWMTTICAKVISSSALCYVLQQVIDRNGNAIYFYYNNYGPDGFPVLSSITDKNNVALLTFNRATDGTYNLTSVADRYNRSVYYQVHTYACQNVPSGFPQSQQELDHVSQVVTTGTPSPPDRYAYGYQNVKNGEGGTPGSGGEKVPFLHTITVPSPTGVGSSTATINYQDNTGFVTSLVDANSNSRTYTAVDQNHTKVTVKDAQNNVIYSYTVGFDGNMSGTTYTNGATDGNGNNTTLIYSATYADPNDPYRPSSALDGNGVASGGTKGKTQATWDSHGNPLTITSPRGTTTTLTWNYSNFALGELTSVQEAGKQATTLTYYEPSGLVNTVTYPLPGTSGGTSTATVSYTYDSLGNVLTMTTAGNNATTGITATYNYTTDVI